MATLSTRRALLGAIAALPAAAVIPTALSARPALAERHEALFAELDAIDAATAHLDTIRATQPEWDAWEQWTDLVWKHIEGLPATPENAKLKARAIWSIVNGKAADINEGESTVCRMVQHVIAALNQEGR